METLARHPLVKGQPVLLLECQCCYHHDLKPPHNMTDLSEVRGMRARSRQGGDGSSDAFFTNRLFPWHHIPDIAVGRLGVVM